LLFNNYYVKSFVSIGVKNNEEASLNRATLSAESAPPVQKCHQSTSKNANEPNGDDFAEAAVEEIESEGLLGEGAVDSPSSPSIPNKRSDSNALCKFNGYSNLEISVFFALALVTSVLFHLHMSELIYKVIFKKPNSLFFSNSRK
jgi:hypothetical protein